MQSQPYTLALSPVSSDLTPLSRSQAGSRILSRSNSEVHVRLRYGDVGILIFLGPKESTLSAYRSPWLETHTRIKMFVQPRHYQIDKNRIYIAGITTLSAIPAAVYLARASPPVSPNRAVQHPDIFCCCVRVTTCCVAASHRCKPLVGWNIELSQSDAKKKKTPRS